MTNGAAQAQAGRRRRRRRRRSHCKLAFSKAPEEREVSNKSGRRSFWPSCQTPHTTTTRNTQCNVIKLFILLVSIDEPATSKRVRLGLA